MPTRASFTFVVLFASLAFLSSFADASQKASGAYACIGLDRLHGQEVEAFSTVSQDPPWHSLLILVHEPDSSRNVMEIDYRPVETDLEMSDARVRITAHDRGILFRKKLARLDIDLSQTSKWTGDARIRRTLPDFKISGSYPGILHISNGKGFDGQIRMNCAKIK